MENFVEISPPNITETIINFVKKEIIIQRDGENLFWRLVK